MGNYQRNQTIAPKDIKDRKAYLVGGGIASLSAAFYLIRDGHMAGENINIFEKLDIEGGSMDGAGNAETGYIIRGGREMEAHYECTWDLFADIPSIENPGFSVLDEFKELNDNDPNISKCRLIHNCGQKKNSDSMELSPSNVKRITELFLATEDALGNTTVEQFFDQSFLETNFWYLWRSMFAFENWHSVVEMKRYMHRFIHLLPGFNTMEGLVFPKYNQYDSFILPLTKYLKDRNVQFIYNTQVTDLDIDIKGNEKTVTAIHTISDNKEKTIPVAPIDLVMVTNGSMTECSEYADNKSVPKLRKDLGSVWKLWKNISEKDSSFGHPDVFCSDVDLSKWESLTITAKNPKVINKIRELSGNDPHSGKTVTGGIITMTDSNWLLSVTCNRQPHFPDQPKDVIVLWAYGLFLDKEGNYIKKTMMDCTSEEFYQELLYHLGLEKDIPEILKTDKVVSAMMPYITSQFMPRVKGDRPNVVPEGSQNLAFLGQFAEIPGDCVFTVEYSIRSAGIATYKLLGLNKKVPEIHPSQYDIRVIANAVKALNSGRPLPAENIIKKLLKDTSMEGLI